ncbi:hypothetical protein AAMO2058_001524400 [Amorphochlora amoebiformis]
MIGLYADRQRRSSLKDIFAWGCLKASISEVGVSYIGLPLLDTIKKSRVRVKTVWIMSMMKGNSQAVHSGNF